MKKNMNTELNPENRYKKSKIIPLIDDIYDFITWGEFAHEYFDKSASWFYNKMRGDDGNGGVGGFTPLEMQTLKENLKDLAARIINAADNIK